MTWRAEDVEELPGFVRWAYADEIPQSDDPPGVLYAWFEPPSFWREAGEEDAERRCSAMRCLARNGARPVLAVLTRERTRHGRRETPRYGFCAEHLAGYGQRVVDGRVLWLGSYR